MNKYIGALCPVCNQELTENDEIVVCPKCGAPYHKACYAQTGQCIFEEELHKQNKDYQLEYPQKADETTIDMQNQCPRCGTKNPSTGIYCISCGTPLETQFAHEAQANGQQNPFGQIPVSPFGSPFAGVDPEEEIGNEKAKDIVAYVKMNTQYYLPRFKMMEKQKSINSFNFSAFLLSIIFPPAYFIYRKMWTVAAILLLWTGCARAIPAIDSITYMINGTSVFEGNNAVAIVSMVCIIIGYVVSFLCGMFANKAYFHHVSTQIARIKKELKPDEDFYLQISKKGGVSMKALLIITATIILLTSIVTYSIIFTVPGAIDNIMKLYGM